MRILLDTHALLWWLLDDPRLSPAARSAIGNGRNEVLTSTASAWEIATKVRLGKLPQAAVLVEKFEQYLTRSRIGVLDVSLSHALLAGRLDGEHKDPFDRMLAAQSRIEGIPLVTADGALQNLGVETIW
ncbi:type II toxin-antitoxin system VapC family toxin [Azospirillum sp. sgz302134]